MDDKINRSWFWISICGATILGIALRLWLVQVYPLWLDEQYSLLFAWIDSPWQLIVGGRDSHPGLFYLLLKAGLQFTQDHKDLRLILVVLPQILSALLLFLWMRSKNFTRKTVALAMFFLLLNPFLIFLGFQLRMYALACLVTVLVYISYYNWERAKTAKNILILYGSLVIANATLYAFVFLTVGVLAAVFWDGYRRKVLPTHAFAMMAFTVAEFFVLNGLSVKDKYEQASSWIPLPSLTNISSTFWTVAGFQDNYFLANYPLQLSDVLFYVLAIIVGTVVWKRKRTLLFVQKARTQRAFFLVLLPVILIMLASFVMWILSQRFFFYQFIPKLSLFLPRTFTPFVVIVSCVLAELLGEQKFRHQKKIIAVIVTVCVLGWIGTLKVIADSLPIKDVAVAVNAQIMSKTQKKTAEGYTVYTLPSWTFVGAIQSTSIEQSEELEKRTTDSEKFFLSLENGERTSCEELDGVFVVYSPLGVAETVSTYYEKKLEYFDRCCTPDEQFAEVKSWTCGNVTQ